MTASETVYAALMRLAMPVSRATLRLGPVLPGGTRGKSWRGLAGMLGAADRLVEWSRRERDSSRGLVWFHAPSVGEGLQARAVIQAVRRLRPELQLIYTYFSPSAVPFADGIPADFTGYLPFDTPAVTGTVLDCLRPSAIVFSKNEIWPNLTREGARRGIPALLLSATLPRRSSRTRGPAAGLLRTAHARLAMVGAISTGDAARYQDFGVRPDRLFLMGDARFDQVQERMERVDREGPLLRHLRNDERPTLVAGSTWPADEEVLLEAVGTLRSSVVPLRLIAAPHEPTPDALRSFEAMAESRGLRTVRLERFLETHSDGNGLEPDPGGDTLAAGHRNGDESDIILIDRVGILGDLYAAGQMAFVGGGFGSAGLHSVLEPAAFGIPVAFGPHHANAREAEDLVQRGAGASVAGARELIDVLGRWATDEDARKKAGQLSAAYVEENLGAAERGARVLLELIGESDPP